MSEVWTKLREKFPDDKVRERDAGFGIVKYVDHGDVTDRLIEADPEYKTEVLHLIGQPEFLERGTECGVILKLTINNVSRQEYGGGANLKEAFSDALKRAAMRFGVALDLWHGGENGSGALGGHTAPSGASQHPVAKAQAAQQAHQESLPVDAPENVVVHWGKFRGQRLGNLPLSQIIYYAEKWEPGHNPQYPATQEDLALQKAAQAILKPDTAPVDDILQNVDDDDIPFS